MRKKWGSVLTEGKVSWQSVEKLLDYLVVQSLREKFKLSASHSGIKHERIKTCLLRVPFQAIYFSFGWTDVIAVLFFSKVTVHPRKVMQVLQCYKFIVESPVGAQRQKWPLIFQPDRNLIRVAGPAAFPEVSLPFHAVAASAEGPARGRAFPRAKSG